MRERTRESFMILVLLYSLYLYYINNRRTYILRWFVHIFAFSHNLCGTLQNWQINVCGETWNMKWAHKHTSNITSFSTSSSQTTTNIFYMHAGGYNGHTKICVRCQCRNVGERFMSVWLLFEMTWFEVTLSKASETERERAQPMWGVIFILIYSSLIHDFHGWYSVIVVFHSFVLGCWDCLCNVHSIHTMYGNCVLFVWKQKQTNIHIFFSVACLFPLSSQNSFAGCNAFERCWCAHACRTIIAITSFLLFCFHCSSLFFRFASITRLSEVRVCNSIYHMIMLRLMWLARGHTPLRWRGKWQTNARFSARQMQ